MIPTGIPITGSLWQRPWYWVMEERYADFGNAHREARAVADERNLAIPVRATWRPANDGHAAHGLRIACLVQPTAVILETLERAPRLRRLS